jgi:hypothetical protein
MAITPLVSWRARDNSDQINRWDIGVVDAGTTSKDFGFLVWNNYLSETDVPDMEDVTIMTKDGQGFATGDLVMGQWIKIKCDTIEGDTFNAIGHDPINDLTVERKIATSGSTVYTYPSDETQTAKTSTPNVEPHVSGAALSTVDILGVANDGSKANSAGNFAEITLHAVVPGNATAGLINFLTRISYKYV